MSRLIALFALLTLFSLGSPMALTSGSFSSSSSSIVPEQAVMICMTSASYAYHSNYCQALKRCTADVETVSVSEAKSFGRRACGHCY
jgi:hypothetical protein